MNPRALIGLGSNLGDRRAILDGAVEELREIPGVNLVAVSRYHETSPVGGPPGQGPFLNAAAVLEPTLGPHSLLGVFQEIEARFGRERTVRWGERTLDLDLLLYSDEILDTPDLTLPHPRFALRRFVLVPLAEIAPAARDPITGRSVHELLSNLDRRPSYLALEGWWRRPDLRPSLEHLVEALNTFCWSQRDLRQILPPDRWREETMKFLRSDIRSYLGERWLVTDFTISELTEAGLFPDPLDLQGLHPIEPTFIVPGATDLTEGRPADLFPATPRLRLEATDPETVAAEIAAACEATRS